MLSHFHETTAGWNPLRPSNVRLCFAVVMLWAWGAGPGRAVGPVRAEGLPAGKPNVVFVLADQWRAQATGYAGDPNVKTPHLDGLARRSIVFENAVSVCPVCTPYRAALMTGRYPLSTGMFLNDLYLPDEELCMAEIFKQAGYETAYIGKWHLDGHGRDVYIPPRRRQGFDYWKVLECTHDYNHSLYYAGDDPQVRRWPGYDAYAQTKDARAYIRDHAKTGKPFLLMISFGPPHFPHHSAPEQLQAMYWPQDIQLRPNVDPEHAQAARKQAQGYYAHCTALDRCVGDLLACLEQTGIAGHTLFVFTSDHGESLGSHGRRPFEKQNPWDESIRVPFLLRYPAVGADTGRVIKTPIGTPDILPTLLSLAGIAVPDTVEGQDLSALVLGQAAEQDRAVPIMSIVPFGGYYARGGRAYRGIRTSRYTYVRDLDGPWLMYDNLADPYQMNNLAGKPAYAALQQELDRRLQAWLDRAGDRFFPPQQYLQAWGYQVDRSHCVPYFFVHRGSGKVPENFRVQSPANRPGRKQGR